VLALGDQGTNGRAAAIGWGKSMALIVQFRLGEAREALEPEPGEREGARIIIFPGVRRERHAEPDRPGCGRGGPGRDWLELQE
jgi:hypothetical protein